MADANLDGNTNPTKVTRPVTGGMRSRQHSSASPQSSASASTTTLHSTTSPSPRINHNPSTNSLRNIDIGGAEIGRGTAQNAALTGASLAFSNSNSGKSKAKVNPPVPNKGNVQLGARDLSGMDGASAAAAKVGVGGSPGRGVVGGRTRSPSKVSMMDERTGDAQQILGQQALWGQRIGESETTDAGSLGGGSEYSGGQRGPQKRNQRSNGYLLPPFSGSGSSTQEPSPIVQSGSAAFMAANLAAKRSSESSPNHTGQSRGMGGARGKPSPLPSRTQSYASSIDSVDRRLDLSSIPPTSNLVRMWDQTDRGGKKGDGGGSGGRGNETLNRQGSPKRPASSNAPIPVSKPAGLARPVSSHAPEPRAMKSTTKPAVKPRPSSSQAPVPEQVNSTSKPSVQPRPSSSQAPLSEQIESITKPPVQLGPVSADASGSEAPKPSPKPPGQKLVIHNTRPVSSHGPAPNLSTKPSIQKLSRPVSSQGAPPTKPLLKPALQSTRPVSSHTMGSTGSFSNVPVNKPSVPPPRRSPANPPESDSQASSNPLMHAPKPLSMYTPILDPADSTDSSSKPSTQPPRRASTVKTLSKSSRPKPPYRSSASKQAYNNYDDDDGSSDDSFVSASSQPKPKSPSWRAKIAQQNRRQSYSKSPMKADSLANAIVAGSLASSRAPTPSTLETRRPPAPPPTRRHINLNIFHSDNSRTPTPPQSVSGASSVPILKSTMRKPKTGKELKEEEGEGEKRRAKKHLVKKHPNKHHEGNRKRWRDGITERERKRYEAVWASNKGLFPYTVNEEGELVEVRGAVDSVPGIVVKDLWERSRLGPDVLEEVWGLVEGRGYGSRFGANSKTTGRLEKDEFVVGMWLIDQRLKGRKLPGKVGHSVWGTAGGLSGLRMD